MRTIPRRAAFLINIRTEIAILTSGQPFRMLQRLGIVLLFLGSALAARRLEQINTFSSTSYSGQWTASDTQPTDPVEWRTLPRVDNQVIIQFAPGTKDSDKAAILGRGYGRALRTVRRGTSSAGEIVLARLTPPSGNFSTFMGAMKFKKKKGSSGADVDDPLTFSVHPNYLYARADVPLVSNDTFYLNGTSMWNMLGSKMTYNSQRYAFSTSAYGINAGRVWANGDTGREGSDVYIGIIDSGIQFTHSDLAVNTFNPRETIDGLDNDGNGFVDDEFGWNFYDDNNNTYVSPDDDGHGTHVAGIIGAAGANGRGVIGVAPKVKFLSGKFLGPGGCGTTAGAVRAIDYFTQLRLAGLNVVATSNSWNCACQDLLVQQAIERASAANVLFISSAGNDGFNVDKNNTANYGFPAILSTPNIISVAAHDKSGNMPTWSNRGAASIDLAAPGVDILSTYPDGYAIMSGTSMAAPHVAGAVALYAAKYNTNNATVIKNAILNSARNSPVGTLSGKVVTGGRLNLANLLNVPC